MTVDWFNQRIDNDFPQNSKISNLLNSRAFILAVVIHLILVLLMINLVSPTIKTSLLKKEKAHVKAIQSYLYHKPKTVQSAATKQKTITKKLVAKKQTKRLKPKQPQADKNNASALKKIPSSTAIHRQAVPQLPTQPITSSKNSLSFSALEQLQQLQHQLDQNNIDTDVNYHNRARGKSVFNDLPAAVKHSEKQLTLSEKREKITTRYGGNIDIVKNDDGNCTLIQDLSNVGMEGITAFSGFGCGQTKMEKAYDAHMDTILRKLGKKK